MNKIRLIYCLFFCFFIGSFCYAQDVIKMDSTKTVYTSIRQIKLDNVFNKQTGTKYSEEEMISLFKKYNNKVHLEIIIDEYGNEAGYYFDPNNPTDSTKSVTEENEVKIGKKFPNFIFETSKDIQLNLEDLKGKYVLLRFDMAPSGYVLKKEEIDFVEKQIISNKVYADNVVPIILFIESSKKEVKELWENKDTIYHLVGDAFSYGIKYGIKIYPSTLVIDRNGNLLKVYSPSGDVNIADFYDK